MLSIYNTRIIFDHIALASRLVLNVLPDKVFSYSGKIFINIDIINQPNLA